MNNNRKNIFKYSFPCFVTYIFLGIGLGVLLDGTGFNVLHGFLVSTLMYSGTMSFLLINFVNDLTPFITIALITIVINSRYAFYGLSFIDKYKEYPWYVRFVLLFTMSDETYSILSFTKRTNEKEDNMAFDLKISLLNYLYWTIGVLAGILLGKLPIDFTGIDFIMTALFTTIVVDQLRMKKSYIEFMLACILSTGFLIVLSSNFILPTILAGIVLLIGLKRFIEKEHIDE